jgi:threonine dehydrogenase-like Zn-dependent dehydrogenase
MLQAIMHGAGDLRLEERPLNPDSITADQVYVETEVTALSTGTDLGNFEGRSREVPDAPDYPRAVGYSNVGRVVRAGKDVTKLQIGQRVFSMRPHQSAFIAQQDELLVPVPENVTSEHASLGYLIELGVAALRQAKYESGESVAVVGLGVIGLCTVGVARAMGARVAAIANALNRLERARRVGAHLAILSDEARGPADLKAVCGAEGADVVILTANTWAAYKTSVDIVRYGGRISVLGFPGRAQPAPGFNPLDMAWFYGKQLTLIGAGYAPRLDCPPAAIRFNLRRNLEYIFALMQTGELDLEPIISHSLPAQQMREAYELARAHSKDLIAAVFDWRGVA